MEIVTVDSITQRACVCPHFALWKQGPPEDSLLNDMLDLWPDLRRIPHDAQQAAAVQQQQGQQQGQQQQQHLEETMQTPCDIAVCRTLFAFITF